MYMYSYHTGKRNGVCFLGTGYGTGTDGNEVIYLKTMGLEQVI